MTKPETMKRSKPREGDEVSIPSGTPVRLWEQGARLMNAGKAMGGEPLFRGMCD